MSKIEKLSIQGVRSFDDKRPEIIQFGTPLTLIVGYNGSGKTTIIECLKYATMGDLPPNSTRGGAFIHDPKLAGEKEVLAQVKLSFKSTKGVKMVATRNLQLQLKKTTRTQKTLEGQLMMVQNGERTSISTRVAELDQIMPQYLGVSKAILDSVIFCHQDESLWPMAEPGSLKKRFDEIFEAQKYTKAIDNIKILRKKQQEELLQFRTIEKYAKEDKEKGERAEKRSAELDEELEKMRDDMKVLDAELAEAQRKTNDAYEMAAKFEKTVARLEGKRIEASAIERNVISLGENMKEMEDTDEELQSHLDQYEARMALYRDEVEVHRQRYSELSHELEERRKALSVKQNEIGKHEAQKDQHDRQIRQRESLIKETSRRHHIRGFELDITDRHVTDFMERLGKMSRDSNAAFERARRETHEELQHAQSKLNEHNEGKSVLSQKKENCRAQINSNDGRVTSLQRDKDKISVDEGSKAVLESTIEDLEARLERARSEEGNTNWDTQIGDANRKLRSVDETKEKLDTELYEATAKAGESARLDLLVKDQKDRQRSLDSMRGAYDKKLSTLLGQEVEPATLEDIFQSELKTKINDCTDAESQRDGVAREVEQLDFKLATAQKSLKRRQEDLKRSEGTVQQALKEDDVKEFPSILDSLELSVNTLRGDAKSFEVREAYFQKCMEFYLKNSACELCRRSVKKDSREAETLRAELQKRISRSSAQAKEDTLNDLREMEADLEAVRAARPSYETWLRLKNNEIPPLVSEVDELNKRRQELVIKQEERDSILKEKDDDRRDLETYSKTVQQITKYHADIVDLKNQIKEMSAKQAQIGAARSLEIIKDDLKRSNEQARHLRSTLTQLQGDRERSRTTISALELEVSNSKSKLSTAVYQLKEKASLESQVQDLRRQNDVQREGIKKLSHELAELNPKIQQATIEYNDIKRRGDDKQGELQQDAAKLSDSLHQVKLANDGINAYIDRGGDQSLARTRREIKTLNEEVTEIEEEQRKTTRDLKKIDESLRNTDDTKRAINDNLRYRRGVKDLENVQKEVENLEAENAEADRARFDDEGAKWGKIRNHLSSQQAELIGTMKSKDALLRTFINDWETDYKDAKYKYKEAHIKVETTKAAVEDLGRYGGALDKAIMKFHTIKMEEINRIVDELWRNTYQGTDVDTIMIRSDNETLKGNKSYNYRVVMVKQDVEMDMRGRCSAGQKMLASIIIRLALAECFGVNCGLIALDEPTTNLDRDNIRSLAQSLASIIKVRRQQANFQLIIITHDDEFLDYMQCGDFADVYFRVSRDERQKSMIRKQQISNVRLG